jgi:hypothetical protein
MRSRTVERAAILASGELGPFERVPDCLLTTARRGASVIVIGPWLYLIGGDDGHALASVERAAIDSDGALGPFTLVPDLQLKTARFGATVDVISDTLWVVGGLVDGELPIDAVERAAIGGDGELGGFTAGGTLSSPRGSHASLRVGDALYVIGGFAGFDYYDTIEQATIGSDGAVGHFAVAAETRLVSHRDVVRGALVGNWYYVVGGLDEHATTGAVTRIAITRAPSLVAAAPPPPINRYEHVTVALGDWLYVIGGAVLADGYDVAQATVLRAPVAADGTLGSFAAAGTLAEARATPVVAVIDDALYVIGGYRDGNALDTVERATIASDGMLGPFARVDGVTLPAPTTVAAAVTLDRQIFVLGGRDTRNFCFDLCVDLDSVVRAAVGSDGTLGPFAAAGVKLFGARSFLGAAVVGPAVYVLGGAFNGDEFDWGMRAPIAPQSGTSLGPFARAEAATLMHGRYWHASVVVGDRWFVFGGQKRGSSGSVSGTDPVTATELAVVGPDGRVAAFAPAGDQAPSVSDAAFSLTTIGNRVYRLGHDPGSFELR